MRVICFDLDDTLYKEIDYLKSAYMLIAKATFGEAWEEPYHQMLQWYKAGEDVFQKVVDWRLDVEKAGLLNMYRYDVHTLSLSMEVAEVLTALCHRGAKLGLITDGRSLTQRNKIGALGLMKWIDKEDMVISEEIGSTKPALANYTYFMERYPECHNFTYIGDNPCKDFIAPNRLGWHTICLKDDGRNIHKQDFRAVPVEAIPKRIVEKLSEIL